MSRTIEDVQREYVQAATALGQLTFQVRESEAQLENLEQEARKQGDKMRHLNKEALKIHKESELAKLEEISKSEEAPSDEASKS